MTKKEDIKDLIESFPRVLYSLIRRPKFREFIKMSIAVPKNLLDYFGYGLYVGRTWEQPTSEAGSGE